MSSDFREFFRNLSKAEQLRFAKQAGYSVVSMRLHLASPPEHRRAVSGRGFARIVKACQEFSEFYPQVPTQHDLLEYFFGEGTLKKTRAQRRRDAAAPAV